MNAFRRMVTVGYIARVFVEIRKPTEREDMAKQHSEGIEQRDVWH